MKRIQDYCNVVNRMKQNPLCREEVISMAKRKDIRLGRRGIAAGTAVAAALLAVNIGGGYLLLSGRSKPETSQTAVSGQIDEQQPCAAQPRYVELMQQYYTGKTGVPCDFDFTGWGKDFEGVSYEDENWRVTLNAVTGCDWVLYYFYDIEPLAGQDMKTASSVPSIDISVPRFDSGVSEGSMWHDTMPGQDEPDNGIYHCCGMVANTSGIPFSQEGTEINYSISGIAFSADKKNLFTLDYTPQAVPLYYREGDSNLTLDFNSMVDPEAEVYPWQQYQDAIGKIPLTHLAMSPFGMFWVSDRFETDTAGIVCVHYTLEQPGVQLGFDDTINQLSEENEIADTYHAGANTYFGVTDSEGNAVAFIHILFDHPCDYEKGALKYADPIISAEDFRETEGAVKITSAVQSDDPEGRIVWKNNDGDTTIEFKYEIDLSEANTLQCIAIDAKRDDLPLQFRYELDGSQEGSAVPAPDGAMCDAVCLNLEPQEKPVTLTLHVQPVMADWDECILNTQFRVWEPERANAAPPDTEPAQTFTFSEKVFVDEEFQPDGGYTYGCSLRETDDSAKPPAEEITFSGREKQLYLSTQLTGHDAAEGENYMLFVRVMQDNREVPFAVTEDGEKKLVQCIGHLPQGEMNPTLTPLYLDLDTAIAESKLSVEIWYQPDVIQPEYRYVTAFADNNPIPYTHHACSIVVAKYEAAEE